MIEFYEDPVNNPMETPTGKIEFYSTGLANFFPDDEERQPVAKWIEESETHHERISCERAKDYPFLGKLTVDGVFGSRMAATVAHPRQFR